MFSPRLILGSKLDSSHFIYSTKTSYQRKRNITHPSKNPDTNNSPSSVFFWFKTASIISAAHLSHSLCSSSVFCWGYLTLKLFFFPKGIFRRVSVLIMPYQSPFWFLCKFPCGVLGNIQSVYYNLGTDKVKENINTDAELSTMYYIPFTDLSFINSCATLLFHVRKMK